MPTLLSNLMLEKPTGYSVEGDIELWVDIREYFSDNQKIVSKASEIPALVDEAFRKMTGEPLIGNPKELTDDAEYPKTIDISFWTEKASKILMQRYYLTVFA